MEVPADPSFDLDTFTAEFLVRFDKAPETEKPFINKYGLTAVTPYWDFRVRTNSYYAFQWRDVDGNERTWQWDFNICDGKWHHIVFGRNYGVEFFGYLDGGNYRTRTDDVGSIKNSRGIYIGRVLNTYMFGHTAFLRIYNRILTSKEVKEHYYYVKNMISKPRFPIFYKHRRTKFVPALA